MNISGTAKVYKREVNGNELYSTSISSKNINGDWEKMYISVQLPRNTTLENNTEINIIKGFLSFYKNKNGLSMPKVVIQEFQIKEEAEERSAIQQEEFYQDNENSLPF